MRGQESTRPVAFKWLCDLLCIFEKLKSGPKTIPHTGSPTTMEFVYMNMKTSGKREAIKTVKKKKNSISMHGNSQNENKRASAHIVYLQRKAESTKVLHCHRPKQSTILFEQWQHWSVSGLCYPYLDCIAYFFFNVTIICLINLMNLLLFNSIM